MSWKGFKKAVTRLPQQVKQKAGYADETYDEEFEATDANFKELEQITKHLSEESKSYMTALQNMMTAQKHFGLAFKQMVHLNEEEPRSQYEAAVESYLQSTETWVDTMSPYVNQTLQSIVLDPSSAFLTITKQVRALIEKRARKLVDYDRNRNALKKAKEKIETSTSADVSKVTKAEIEFEESRRDYETLNEKLKREIPVLVHMRIDFMNPLIEALISFQIYFFEQGASILQPLGGMIDFSQPVEETFIKRREPALENLKKLSLVVPIKIDANADPSTRNEYLAPGRASGEADLPDYNEAAGGTPTAIPVASSSSSSSSSGGGAIIFALAIYPFQSDNEGDLTFEKDQKIQIIQKTDKQDDWWTGRIGNREGYFPANYVKLL